MEVYSDAAIKIINELHTERLDYNSEYLPLIDAANQLSAYEDTGLTPEEIKAMRPAVTREQVEKVWKGEWIMQTHTTLEATKCAACGTTYQAYYENYQFCPRCGAAMTDKAVDIIVKRLEVLHD